MTQAQSVLLAKDGSMYVDRSSQTHVHSTHDCRLHKCVLIGMCSLICAGSSSSTCLRYLLMEPSHIQPPALMCKKPVICKSLMGTCIDGLTRMWKAQEFWVFEVVFSHRWGQKEQCIQPVYLVPEPTFLPMLLLCVHVVPRYSKKKYLLKAHVFFFFLD